MPRSRATASNVVLDLNNPEFLKVFLALDTVELNHVAKTLKRIQGMPWDTVYKAAGLKWESLTHLTAPNGAAVHSIRLSGKVRALAYRDGAWMRFLSLHPDHDSACER